MSSENTARQFRLGPYLEYVASLPAPGQSSSPSTNQASRKRSRKIR